MTTTLVHALRVRLPRVNAAWLSKDVPDLDNALNMLSSLSVPIEGARGTSSVGCSGSLFA